MILVGFFDACAAAESLVETALFEAHHVEDLAVVVPSLGAFQVAQLFFLHYLNNN